MVVDLMGSYRVYHTGKNRSQRGTLRVQFNYFGIKDSNEKEDCYIAPQCILLKFEHNMPVFLFPAPYTFCFVTRYLTFIT